jgi:hypothetical protein
MPNVLAAGMPACSPEGSRQHVLQRYLVYRVCHLFLIGFFIFSYGLLVMLLVID